MPFDPSLLVVGAIGQLPGVEGSVRLLNVQPGPFVTLTYEGAAGLGQVTYSEEELALVEVAEPAPPCSSTLIPNASDSGSRLAGSG